MPPPQVQGAGWLPGPRPCSGKSRPRPTTDGSRSSSFGPLCPVGRLRGALASPKAPRARHERARPRRAGGGVRCAAPLYRPRLADYPRGGPWTVNLAPRLHPVVRAVSAQRVGRGAATNRGAQGPQPVQSPPPIGLPPRSVSRGRGYHGPHYLVLVRAERSAQVRIALRGLVRPSGLGSREVRGSAQAGRGCVVRWARHPCAPVRPGPVLLRGRCGRAEPAKCFLGRAGPLLPPAPHASGRGFLFEDVTERQRARRAPGCRWRSCWTALTGRGSLGRAPRPQSCRPTPQKAPLPFQPALLPCS